MNTKLVVTTLRGETVKGVDVWRRLATVAAINAIISSFVWTVTFSWSNPTSLWGITIAVVLFLALTLCRFNWNGDEKDI